MTTIICFSGPRGAGKSTAVRFLKRAYGIPVLHVSYILKELARRKGMTNKQFADELRKAGGERAIVGAISGYLKHSISQHESIIVDGIYKMDDIEAIKEHFPTSKVVSIFVTADQKTRIERVQRREKISTDSARERVAQADLDRSKLGYNKVMEKSDFIIQNKDDIRQFYQSIFGVAKKSAGPAKRIVRRRNKL